jgi:uncharacterized protein (TIGR00369 family)
MAKKWFAQYGVPMNRALGLRIDVVEADSGRVVVRLPARRRNLNVGGTVHGAAIFALAETVHGIAVFWQFAPAGHRMATRQARLEFLAPARGTLTCSFGLEEPARRRIAGELERCGACDVEFSSEVRDGQGKKVARLVASYAIRRREGGPKAASGGASAALRAGV